MKLNGNDAFHKPFGSRQAGAGWSIVTALSLAGLLWSISVQADADAAAGKQIYYTRCLGCHGDENTASTIGPSLNGIIGRKAANGESGVHSRALMEADIRWDEASLRKFLADPSKAVPGTIMPVSVPDAKQLDDLLAYLRTLR
jgi:cytochrome c2